MDVSNELGPWLDDSIYEACLRKEFSHQGIGYIRIHSFPFFYKGERLEDTGFRFNVIVEDMVLVEVNSLVGWNPKYEDLMKRNLAICKKKHCLSVNFRAESESELIHHLKI